jgi:antitoxin MazE
MKVSIRRVGNSKGMIVPSAILAQVGLEDEAELTVEDGALVVRPPKKSPRAGWSEASKSIAEAGDDALVLPDFPNEMDDRLKW